jgi:UPF0755 protein
MRKYLVLISFVFVSIIAASLGLIWYFSQTTAPSTNSEEKRFVITKGSSATKIANDLAEVGLIKSALAFKVYTQINGISDSLPPGQFKIPQNLSVEEVIGLLRAGPTELWVTIPEGLRREQYPKNIAEDLELSPAASQSFEEEFLALTEDMEGYLYPDTYLFPPDATASQVVSVLTNTFDKKFTPTEDELAAVGLNLDEAVTLASIIERETKNADERPTVAGIYFNRLSAVWPLQADATLQYILGDETDWWVPPAAADKELNSPFNTYRYPGLPPAPIANPSLTSLESVIKPEDMDYWYYIHDRDGNIHYARTLEEHNLNIQRYLR